MMFGVVVVVGAAVVVVVGTAVVVVVPNIRPPIAIVEFLLRYV